MAKKRTRTGQTSKNMVSHLKLPPEERQALREGCIMENIKEIKMISEALTEEEIKQLEEAGKSLLFLMRNARRRLPKGRSDSDG